MRRIFDVPDQLNPAWTIAIAAGVTILNYVVAPAEFPALFFFPVIYAAWYGGRRWALPCVLLPLMNPAMLSWLGADGDTVYVALISATVRVVMTTPIAIWIADVASSQRELRQEVALLEGLLPICSYCKKIRDDDGQWQRIEKYIEERSDATFTHGICESCLAREEQAWKRA